MDEVLDRVRPPGDHAHAGAVGIDLVVGRDDLRGRGNGRHDDQRCQRLHGAGREQPRVGVLRGEDLPGVHIGDDVRHLAAVGRSRDRVGLVDDDPGAGQQGSADGVLRRHAGRRDGCRRGDDAYRLGRRSGRRLGHGAGSLAARTGDRGGRRLGRDCGTRPGATTTRTSAVASVAAQPRTGLRVGRAVDMSGGGYGIVLRGQGHSGDLRVGLSGRRVTLPNGPGTSRMAGTQPERRSHG